MCCIVWIISQVCFHYNYSFFFLWSIWEVFSVVGIIIIVMRGNVYKSKVVLKKLSKCYTLNTTQSSTHKIFTWISYKLSALLFHVIIRKDAICICPIFNFILEMSCCCKFCILNTFLRFKYFFYWNVNMSLPQKYTFYNISTNLSTSVLLNSNTVHTKLFISLFAYLFVYFKQPRW